MFLVLAFVIGAILATGLFFYSQKFNPVETSRAYRERVVAVVLAGSLTTVVFSFFLSFLF